MNNKIKKATKNIAISGLIAAVYIALVIIFQPISFRQVQFRIAESLTVLPFFTVSAIPGLFIGCLVGNILGGAAILDILFGSLATLIGAIITFILRKRKYLFAPVGPIVSNTLIIPFVLKYAYAITLPIWISMIYIGIGEIISCGILDLILLLALKKTNIKW